MVINVPSSSLRPITEIYKFREGAWDPINGRVHEVVKVYVSEFDENDVVVIGKVTFKHKSGSSVTQDFVGNFMFAQGKDATLVERYQAWLVCLSI